MLDIALITTKERILFYDNRVEMALIEPPEYPDSSCKRCTGDCGKDRELHAYGWGLITPGTLLMLKK